jgi:Ca-activated chloride channel homolog
MTSPERNRDRTMIRTLRDRYRIRIPPLLLLLVIPGAAHAQGWVEPRPGTALPQSWGIEKLRTSVSVRVVDRVATVEVEEWFRNNGGGLGEGDYVYPLPGDAVFTGYSLYQGDQELRGEMMDADRARSIYESIVRAQRDPALIELIGRGMVRARVFPIEPGQTRRITLRYTQVLDGAGDALHFRYAAGIRHTRVRREQVTPLPLPLPVPVPVPVPPIGGAAAPLTFTLTVEDGARFRDAFSPTHAVRVQREGTRMVVRPRSEIAGDFAVFLPYAERSVGIGVATHRPAGEDGYFMLTLTPGEVAESRVSRDMTIVVDVSGSMSGEKMEQARRALHQLLGTLTPADRFRMISFSSRVMPWRGEWTAATRAELRVAGQWVDELRAEGGTDIHGALEAAFRAESPAARLPMVIFLTDGLPTNGETRTDRIVAMAESRRGHARIFVFGVGYDVNTNLLDLLSGATRGTTQYVRPDESVEEAVSLLAAKIRHPVLTDLTLERGPVRLKEVYPRELPDLFAGEELVVFGRYDGAGQGAVVVTGRRGTSAERYTTQARFPQQERGSEYVSRLWAARRIGDLDRRIRSARADGATRQQVQELVDELRETALRYGLLSEHTAYLVEEPAVVVQGAGIQGRRPVAAAPPLAVTGASAVLQAEQARRALGAATVADVEAVQRLAAERLAFSMSRSDGRAAAGRTVGGRTFTLRDGVWYDARHTDSLRVVTIEPYSPAYFALLRALPELAHVLRELDAVVIAGARVALRFAPDGRGTLAEPEVRRIAAEFRTAAAAQPRD